MGGGCRRERKALETSRKHAPSPGVEEHEAPRGTAGNAPDRPGRRLGGHTHESQLHLEGKGKSLQRDLGFRAHTYFILKLTSVKYTNLQPTAYREFMHMCHHHPD